MIVLSVVTQNSQALEAQQQNASKSDAVINAIKASAADAEVKTDAYSLQPQPDYRDNKLPGIVSYEARNALMITLNVLDKVGAVIDAASRAGANSINRICFTLKDTSLVKGNALAEATSQAVTKAKAIAEAMRGQVVRLVEEPETTTPDTALDAESYTDARRPVTPVQAGPIKVKSRVQLIVEVDAQPK